MHKLLERRGRQSASRPSGYRVVLSEIDGKGKWAPVVSWPVFGDPFPTREAAMALWDDQRAWPDTQAALIAGISRLSVVAVAR